MDVKGVMPHKPDTDNALKLSPRERQVIQQLEADPANTPARSAFFKMHRLARMRINARIGDRRGT